MVGAGLTADSKACRGAGGGQEGRQGTRRGTAVVTPPRERHEA